MLQAKNKKVLKHKKIRWATGLGVVPLLLAVGFLVGCGCSGNNNDNNKIKGEYEAITAQQVTSAIENEYPNKFGKSARSSNCASDFNVYNVPGFAATINNVPNVKVKFSNLEAKNPEGTYIMSNTLVLETTITHVGLSPRELGFLQISGFEQDTILTATNENVLMKYDPSTQMLRVNFGVTVDAFILPSKYSGVTTLKLPESLKVIENNVFASLSNLADLNLQDVQYVAANAFLTAPLRSIIWPDVKFVGSSAFAKANFITNFNLPPNLVILGANAFVGWRNSSSVVLAVPNSLQKIGASAFLGANITGLTIDKSDSQLSEIGNSAFANSLILGLTCPDNLVSIGSSAFGRSPLSNLTLDAHLKTVGAHSFRSAVITTLTLPASVVSVGKESFFNAPLKSLTIQNTSETPSQLTTVSRSAFENASLESLTIPESVTTVGASAFLGSRLLSLTFSGPYRNNLFLADNAFHLTNPSNVRPEVWQQITKRFPNAFESV